MEARTGRARRAAGLALAITVVLAVAKVAAWSATSSLALLSQALDSLVDVVALSLLFVGIRIAEKPADESHHYGHAKAENLVAFVQTLILGVIVIGVLVEAADQLLGEPTRVQTPWYVFVLLGISIVVDAVRVTVLGRAARSEHSEALSAGALNFATDIGTAVVALISLMAVRAGFERADAAGGVVVAIAVAIAAFTLGKRSVDVLMDRAPRASADAIAEAAARATGVAETRRVRVRGTEERLFADVTVAAGRTASLERAHDIAEAVEKEIAQVAPGTDVVVHVEPASETSGLVERVQAAASRTPGVHEVHNVLVHAFDEGGRSNLHVTLHAKVEPNISLEEAHRLSDEIEDTVAAELDREVRVDTHLEPLERTLPGRDVTENRSDIVESVKRLATTEPDVLDCHEVVVTSSDGQLSIVAHVRGRKDLPLARMHAASERIEKAIHSAHPEVGPVVIHFEPA
jgi:cation diffusion facilitator family transporter